MGSTASSDYIPQFKSFSFSLLLCTGFRAQFRSLYTRELRGYFVEYSCRLSIDKIIIFRVYIIVLMKMSSYAYTLQTFVLKFLGKDWTRIYTYKTVDAPVEDKDFRSGANDELLLIFN